MFFLIQFLWFRDAKPNFSHSTSMMGWLKLPMLPSTGCSSGPSGASWASWWLSLASRATPMASPMMCHHGSCWCHQNCWQTVASRLLTSKLCRIKIIQYDDHQELTRKLLVLAIFLSCCVTIPVDEGSESPSPRSNANMLVLVLMVRLVVSLLVLAFRTFEDPLHMEEWNEWTCLQSVKTQKRVPTHPHILFWENEIGKKKHAWRPVQFPYQTHLLNLLIQATFPNVIKEPLIEKHVGPLRETWSRTRPNPGRKKGAITRQDSISACPAWAKLYGTVCSIYRFKHLSCNSCCPLLWWNKPNLLFVDCHTVHLATHKFCHMWMALVILHHPKQMVSRFSTKHDQSICESLGHVSGTQGQFRWLWQVVHPCGGSWYSLSNKTHNRTDKYHIILSVGMVYNYFTTRMCI